MKITERRGCALDAKDWLELAALLVKAGYTVRIGKEKATEKAPYRRYAEALDE